MLGMVPAVMGSGHYVAKVVLYMSAITRVAFPSNGSHPVSLVYCVILTDKFCCNLGERRLPVFAAISWHRAAGAF